jgi:hypothetical protein
MRRPVLMLWIVATIFAVSLVITVYFGFVHPGTNGGHMAGWAHEVRLGAAMVALVTGLYGLHLLRSGNRIRA